MVILLATSLLFARSKFVNSYQDLEKARVIINNQERRDQYLDFLSKFVRLVIKSEEEVSFEARLELENSVKKTGDQELLDIWQKFAASTSESEAQNNTKELLEILANKI